jgi:hypothetical protein
VIPELPQQPTLPDARPVMAAVIGVRRGIRNSATTSSFLDPETRQLLRTQANPSSRTKVNLGPRLGPDRTPPTPGQDQV